MARRLLAQHIACPLPIQRQDQACRAATISAGPLVLVGYLPASEAVSLLHSRHASLAKGLLKQIVKAARDLRKAHATENLTTGITTRRLLAMCARLERGSELPRALEVCVLNKAPQEDTKVIRETFEHHLGPRMKENRDSK